MGTVEVTIETLYASLLEMILCVCTHVCVNVPMLCHRCGSQRITCGSVFNPRLSSRDETD